MVVSRPAVYLVFALLFVTAAAGCLGGDDDPGPSGGTNDDGGEGTGGGGGGGTGGGGGGGGSTPEGEGALAGIVLDDGFSPIHGASVRLSRDGSTVKHTSTPENGRFEFKEVPAGEYRLEATAACCRETAQRVYVEPDETLTKDIQLQRRSADEAQRPVVLDDEWNGFISCGVNVMEVVQEDPCVADDNQETEYVWNVTAGLRTLYLYTCWEGQTDGVAEELSVSVSTGTHAYASVEGISPLVLRIDNEAIEDPALKFENIDGQRELTIEVLSGGDVSAAFQQAFTVIVLEFHWRPAPEGFEFVMPDC